jgi:hypothetical protein
VTAATGSGALILFRHRANVRRILNGTERRTDFRPEAPAAAKRGEPR